MSASSLRILTLSRIPRSSRRSRRIARVCSRRRLKSMRLTGPGLIRRLASRRPLSYPAIPIPATPSGPRRGGARLKKRDRTQIARDSKPSGQVGPRLRARCARSRTDDRGSAGAYPPVSGPVNAPISDPLRQIPRPTSEGRSSRESRGTRLRGLSCVLLCRQKSRS